MENAARVWFEGDLRQRQQIQPAIFPAGPPFTCEEFGAAASCLAFMQLEKLDQADGVPSGIRARRPRRAALMAER